MADKTFASGLYPAKPHHNAPEFVKMRLSFNVEQFIQFLKDNVNEKGYTNVDVLESKDGEKLYGVLNEWKKPEGLTGEKAEQVKAIRENAIKQGQSGSDDIKPEEIPF